MCFHCISNDKNACYRWNGRLDDFVSHSFYPSGSGKGCAAIKDVIIFNDDGTLNKIEEPTLVSEPCSMFMDRSSNKTYKGVCQYKACKTINNKMCKFPFR